MPIGVHHLFEDPQVGSGFKFLHSVFTALVTVPTLLTVFTICASVEIAGRLRGGKGALGWLAVLPWHNPVMLGAALSFVMLGFGGAGGVINMSYQLNSTIHNTQWVTGHFHLIFGGAIVIMYFVIAYDVWPHLTGRALDDFRLMRWQLWTWFIGMIVLTFPWHYVGILGMPRRMAFYDYTDPVIAAQAASVVMSVIGGADPGGFRRAVPAGAGTWSVGAAEPAWRLPLQRGDSSAAHAARRAERSRAMGRADARTDDCELRLPDRPCAGDPGHGRARRPCRLSAMSGKRTDIWLACSIGMTAAVAVGAFAIGFIWLPLADATARFHGAWNAICAAAGLVQTAPDLQPIQTATYPVTQVEVIAPDAAPSECGLSRKRCDARIALHDVPRAAWAQSG